jgi:hypothetical protein
MMIILGTGIYIIFLFMFNTFIPKELVLLKSFLPEKLMRLFTKKEIKEENK